MIASYSQLNAKLLKGKGIILYLEFVSVQFRKMIIQQYLNSENYFFFEVLIQQEELLRTLPLQYEDFCRV